ncbi:MAG: hypothetical protein ACTSX6_04690 [Candidatus Heimdallarchaeaceae archaeon]
MIIISIVLLVFAAIITPYEANYLEYNIKWMILLNMKEAIIFLWGLWIGYIITR